MNLAKSKASYSRRVSCIVVAFAVATFTADAANAQNTIQGDCASVLTQVEATTININCQALDSHTGIEVRYLLLDSATYSLLLAGNTIDDIDQVVGKHPRVVDNPTNKAFVRLRDAFGMRVDGSTRRIHIQNEDRAGRVNYSQFEFPSSIKVLDRFSTFLYPDIEATKTVAQSHDWPQDYSIVPGSWYSTADSQLVAPLLWKPLQSADLAHYADRMQVYFHAFASVPAVATQARWESGGLYVQASLRGNLRIPTEAQRAIDFLMYIAGDHWPQKMVQAQIVAPYGTAPWRVAATPPLVRVVVLVVSLVSDKPTHREVRTYKATRSKYDYFRSAKFDADGVAIEAPFSTGTLSTEQSVILPMQVEIMRSGVDWLAGNSSEIMRNLGYAKDDAAQLQIAKQRLTDDTTDGMVTFYVGGRALRKAADPLLASLSHPEPQGSPTGPSEVYVFGPRERNFKLVFANGAQVALRPPHWNILTIDHGIIAAQCPIAYVLRKGGSEPVLIGRVLVNANNAQKSREEIVDLGSAVSDVVLAEDEAETSFVKSMTVEGKRHGGSQYVALASTTNAAIRYGDRLTLHIGPSASFDRFRLRVRGYYERVGNLALTGLPALHGKRGSRGQVR